jgi:hypothetical protein
MRGLAFNEKYSSKQKVKEREHIPFSCALGIFA